MSWSPEIFLQSLEAAVDSFDRPGAAALCDELVADLRRSDEIYPKEPAIKVLDTLRRKCYFDLMQRVADALIRSGQAAPKVRRQYAQSLIDQDNLTAALSALEALAADTAEDPGENAEARGLIGRVYKQWYVEGDPRSKRGRERLERAVAAYYEVYRFAPETHLWQGINTVALLARGQHDGVELSGFPKPAELAGEILQSLEVREAAGTLDPWDLATAAEACVALGRNAEALGWILRYVQPGTDAFNLASTLRQFTEVWQLDTSSEPGASLLPFLRSQLLERKGGRVDLEASELRTSLAHRDDEGFEKILGDDRTVTLHWYRTGLNRCLSVARIETRGGKGVGTGFLIRGGDLYPALNDELVLLTNAHVVSNDLMVQVKREALHPQKAVITFEVLPTGAGSKVEHRIAELLWTSPPELLDATLLRLDPPVRGIEPYPIAPPPLPDADGRRRVYIIGHPGGRSLEISLHDNLLLDAEDPKLHYRAPTERGSSGSPVFDTDWDLVGLHHAGRLDMPRLRGQEGSYAANEAIWIQAIIQRLADEWGPPEPAMPPEGLAVEPADRGLESAPPEAARLPPDKPLVTHENVKFTVYKPRVVAPFEWYPLLAFAHLEDLAEEPGRKPEESIEEEVREQARQALGDLLPAYADDSEDSSQAIPPDAEITFVPTIPGFRFNPPQATFLWLEAIHREEFRMQAPPQLDGQIARGRLSVYWGRILLAELNLKIRVDSGLVESATAAVTKMEAVRPYQDIFASYSHKDTAIVLEFERYVKTLGHRYLIDRSNLRAGEVWDERLQGMIREADAFQLFWSRNSMQSEFVQKEWRYALSLGRDSFVRPTYWEEPLPEMSDQGIPPPELKKLHFHLFSGASAAPAVAAAPPPGTTAVPASVPAPPAPLPPKSRSRKLVLAGSLAAALFAVILVFGLFPSANRETATDGPGSVDIAIVPPPGSVTIGRSIDPDGTIPEQAQETDFAAGEAVIAAVPVEEFPAGERVRVVWVGPDGTPVSEETKQVEAGAAYLGFSTEGTAAWEKGDYRAEVWVGSEKITERSFEITAEPAPPPPY